MNRAELAAEVLRIHDLILEPKHDEQWDRVTEALWVAREAAIDLRSKSREPGPIVRNGMGRCTVTCPKYEPAHAEWSGRCYETNTPTVAWGPCGPWMEGRMRELGKQLEDWQDVVQYERQAAASARAELHRCKVEICKCEVAR